MTNSQEDLIPWLNDILFGVALAALIAMVASLVLAAIKWRRPARRRLLWFALGGFLVSVTAIASNQWLLFHVWLPSLQPDLGNDEDSLTHVDQAAPDFALMTTEGVPFRLKELRGRVVLVNFFATWCVPCRQELPHLQRIWEEYSGDGDFRMVVVGQKESLETVKNFKEERHFGFPMAPDLAGSVFADYATESIPWTYLIDRNGIIVYQCKGYYKTEISKLRALIQSELKKGG
jgi:peroxiredoxin